MGSRRRSWLESGWQAGVAAGTVALAAACGGSSTGVTNTTNGVNLNLSVGQSQVLQPAGQVLEVNFASSSSASEYRLAFENANSTSGSKTSMRVLTSTSGAAPSVAPSAERSPIVGSASGARLSWPKLLQARDRTELLLQRNVRELLARVRPEAARPGFGGASVAALATVPAVGDTLRFSFPISGTSFQIIACDSTSPDTITAVVQRVSAHGIFVADTANPASFSSADYDRIAADFDDFIYPVDSAYFGAPADIDGNGHVIVLFTKEVNALSSPTGQTFVGGFFIPTDLARRPGSTAGSSTSGTCQHSNQAELLYLAAPDPNGVDGPQFPLSDALRNARSVTSHEFQHLISAEDRVIKSNGDLSTDLIDTWLGEGMSHIAEEVVGLAEGGHGVRQNLAFSDVTGHGLAALGDTTTQTTIFNTFFLDNYFRMAYFLTSPNSTQALALSDPSGIASLQMRGFAYLFLRWLGDQYGPSGSGVIPGSDEQALFQRIASGGASHQTGVDDILGAVGDVAGQSVTWPQVLARFSIMPDVDDISVNGTPVTITNTQELLPSWNLRDIFNLLSQPSTWSNNQTPTPFKNTYPLTVTQSGFVVDTLSFDVNAGTAKYLELSGSVPASGFTLQLTDLSGNALPTSSGAQVTVVRTH